MDQPWIVKALQLCIFIYNDNCFHSNYTHFIGDSFIFFFSFLKTSIMLNICAKCKIPYPSDTMVQYYTTAFHPALSEGVPFFHCELELLIVWQTDIFWWKQPSLFCLKFSFSFWLVGGGMFNPWVSLTKFLYNVCDGKSYWFDCNVTLWAYNNIDMCILTYETHEIIATFLVIQGNFWKINKTPGK